MTILDNIQDDDIEYKELKEEYELMQKLIEQDIYKQSSKPWEYVNVDRYLSCRDSMKRYFFAIYKVLSSYSELFCYFWMIFATIVKAGILYLVYPIFVFGYCLLEE